MPLQLPFVPLIVGTSAVCLAVGRCTSEVPTSVALSFGLPTVVSIYLFYHSWLYPFYISPLRHVPTVPGFPLWGQFFTIITTEVGVVQRDWHAQHGGIVRYFFPFGAERLSITDDDAIKQMTVRNPYNFPKPIRAKNWMMPVLGEGKKFTCPRFDMLTNAGVLLAEGQTHVKQRKALSPAFSIASIRSLMPIFWNKCLHMSELWQGEMKTENTTSKCFEVLEWLNRTTLDIIGRAGLGTDVDSLDNPEDPLRKAYRKCFDFGMEARIINGLAAFVNIVRLIPSKTNSDLKWARTSILTRATKIIKEKQAQSEAARDTKQKDIIGLIIKDNMTASVEDTLNVEEMRDQVMTMLGAGHDTTATSVAWTLLLLAKHQGVQAKLREEIRTHMPFLFDKESRYNSELIGNADVDLLPYMELVTRESLRYIPSIPMTVRQCREDDQLGPHHIPAGTIVYLIANCINRLESYWGPTANTFDPERWNKLPETYTTNAFMTFLQGPRGCIGRKFAEVEMKTLLCTLLSKFKFEPDATVQDPEELKMWRLVLRPRDGISLKVTLLDS